MQENQVILIVISGTNLAALLGLLGKIWSWSTTLEGRLSRIEERMSGIEENVHLSLKNIQSRSEILSDFIFKDRRKE